MVEKLDFFLLTHPGISNDFWIAMSSMVNMLIKHCWNVFGVLLLIRILFLDVLSNIANWKFDWKIYARTTVLATLIGIFLIRYKFFIKSVDSLIYMLCAFDPDPAILTYEGIKHLGITIMYHIRVVMLFITISFGPHVASLCVWSKSAKLFASWARVYITLSCSAIYLNIAWEFTKVFSSFPLLQVNPDSSFFEQNIDDMLLSIAFFIGISSITNLTYKYLGKPIEDSINYILNIIFEKLGMGDTSMSYSDKRNFTYFREITKLLLKKLKSRR